MADSINIDFTGVDLVPAGEALVAVSKIEKKQSSNGNKMLAVQLKIVEGEDPAFAGRVVFDNWMLESQAVFRTKQALDAFLGDVPAGPTSFSPDDLVGKQAWVLLEVEEGSGEYAGTKRSRVKRYGIDPTR